MAAGAAATKGAGALIEGNGAAMQYLGQGKDGNDVFDPDLYRNPALWERLFNRGTEDILSQERQAVEAAIAEGAIMQPEFYRALGYEPEFEDRTADLEAARQRRDEIKSRLTALESRRARRRGGKGEDLGGKYDWADQPGKLRKEIRRLRGELSAAETELGDISANPVRIRNFRKVDPSDPTDSRGGAFREAFDLQNEALVRALQGQEPIDATLQTEYENREKILREKLRRQLGADYETTTAGSDALANFDREKSEAFSQYNREVVGQYSGLSENRAKALSDLTSARLGQLNAPSQFALGRAGALGEVAKARDTHAQLLLQARQKQGGATLIPNDDKNLVASGIALEKFGSAFSGSGGGGGGGGLM